MTLIFSPAPHIHRRRDTRRSMLHVIVALTPAVLTALWYFGMPALVTLAVCLAACVGSEWLIARYVMGRRGALPSLSAAITGILLALNLPADLPWWTAVIGSLFAIAVVKMAFGGLGCNIFNPALAGRVFLLLSFPALMTVWPEAGGGFHAAADGVTGATALELLKYGGTVPDTLDLLTGHMGGSMGETGAVAILIGLVYMLCAGIISWHIPVAILATVTVFCALIGQPVLVNLLSGGLLLGAVFMATDYVTSPMTRRGMLVYGVLIGVITVIIRRWGAYPEGMSFAILLGNATVPLIDRYIHPRIYSPRRKEAAA